MNYLAYYHKYSEGDCRYPETGSEIFTTQEKALEWINDKSLYYSIHTPRSFVKFHLHKIGKEFSLEGVSFPIPEVERKGLVYRLEE